MNEKNLYTFSEQRTISALKEVLVQYGFSERFDFSIGEYAESRVCLLKAGDKWEVFVGERGEKTSIKRYGELSYACIQVIEFIALDNVSLGKMKRKFSTRIYGYGNTTAARRRGSRVARKTVQTNIVGASAYKIITAGGKITSTDKIKSTNKVAAKKQSTILNKATTRIQTTAINQAIAKKESTKK